jgi:hypothetical protein
MYLHKLFRSIADTVSLHEPAPAFQDASRLSYEERLTWLREKIDYIKGIAQSNYVETSNQFIRGWPELFIELDEVPDVIVIRRPAREVALSMWRMGWIPARSDVARRYGIKPDDENVLLQKIDYKYWTDYMLCYWACLEKEERVKRYIPMLVNAGAMVAETSLAEIITLHGFLELLKALEIKDYDHERLHDLIGVRFNSTRPDAQIKWPHGDLDNQEKDVEREFVEKNGN